MVLGAGLLGRAPAAAGAPLSFGGPFRIPAPASFSLPFSSDGTEPRIVVAPSGAVYVIASPDRPSLPASLPNPEARVRVYRSLDDGVSFSNLGGEIPGQTTPSTDVDVATTATGRLIAVEEDETGPYFAVAYSDDGGRTWRASGGARLIDQDRPWLATGPRDPVTHRPRVYLLWHNVFTGLAAENVFVQVSRDGGASFGPPVPITHPSEAAWSDLQCGGTPAPNSISVNQRTGRIYVAFGVATAPPLGGCGEPARDGGAEFLVPVDRIWVATSPSGAAGTWRLSKAVDDSASQRIVEMQFAPAALDSDGNVYLVYPESPRPYPDYGGASVMLRWAPPDLARWSAPITLAPGGGPGNILTHIAVGDPGKVDAVYLHGEAHPGTTPAWYLTVSHMLDALDPTAPITSVRASGIPAYTGTASQLEQACTNLGLTNLVTCNRASDVWGVTLDHTCRLLIAWAGVKNDASGSQQATFISRQESGPRLCTSP
jgi:hypothetical protein